MNKALKKVILNIGSVFVTSFVGLSAVAMIKKNDSQFENEPDQKNPMEGKAVIFIEDPNDRMNADGYKGHLEAVGDSVANNGLYEIYVKRAFDIVLSFCGLVALSPMLLGTAIAIMIDDPGPVLFTQKRVGKNKKYFKLHNVLERVRYPALCNKAPKIAA